MGLQKFLKENASQQRHKMLAIYLRDETKLDIYHRFFFIYYRNETKFDIYYRSVISCHLNQIHIFLILFATKC